MALPRNTGRTFQNLSDLFQRRQIFERISDTLHISLQDKAEISLRDFVVEYGELKWFTVEKLIDLTANDRKCLIYEDSEKMPDCYITRNLWKNIIETTYLNKITKNDFVLICRANQTNEFDDVSPGVTFLESAYMEIFFNNRGETPVVFLAENECSQEDFDRLCEKYNMATYQQFRYISSMHLEWIRGKNVDLNELRKSQIRIPNQYLQEDELFGQQYHASVRIICAEPGMGKSTLMKRLKEKTSPKSWTLLIYARNYTDYFKKKILDGDSFIEHILREKYSEHDSKMLRVIKAKKQLEVIWDGLDEVPEKYHETVTTIIGNVVGIGLKQWITSRHNLRRFLEDKFGVLSVALTEFNEEQQKYYIKTRLNCSDDYLEEIYERITKNIRLFPYNSILGIPLQIYMLTELFVSKDKEKYYKLINQDNIFSIADLYHYFVKERFKTHCIEKSGLDLKDSTKKNEYKDKKKMRVEKYKEAAIWTYFEKEVLKEMGAVVNCKSFFDDIRRSKDDVGFIIKVGEDYSCEFFHNSYGEYFAALYLVELDSVSNITRFFMEEKYNNIRFFYDLILAKKCKTHKAVLYKNYELLEECEDFSVRDQLGRNALQIACMWTPKYPLLTTVSSQEDKYIIRDFKEWMNKNDFTFQKILNLLVTRCGVEEIEHSLFYNDSLLLVPFMTKDDEATVKSGGDFEKYLPSLLCYAIQLHYSSLLECFNNLPLIEEEHSGKTLLDWAMDCDSVDCLKVITTKTQYMKILCKDRKHLYKMCSKPIFRDVFKSFFNDQVSINGVDERKKTVLNYACDEEDLEAIRFCVQIGASLDIVDENGLMPLHRECRRGNLEVVKFLLLECGAKIHQEDRSGLTPLYYACEKDSKKIVEFLVSSKMVKVNDCDKHKKLPIHYACENNSLDTLKFLVDNGSDKDAMDDEGLRPIHHACRRDFKDVVKYLIEQGVDADSPDKHNRLPIHYASESNSLDILKLLVNANAKTDLEDDEGLLPIHYACKANSIQSLEFLIDNDASVVNIADRNGKYPIHYACEYDADFVVKRLLEKGVDVNVRDGKKKTPLHYAYESRNYELEKLLVEAGADVDAVDDRGLKPEEYA